MKALLVSAVSLLVLITAGVAVLLVRSPDPAATREARARVDSLSADVQALRNEIAARKAGDLSTAEHDAILKVIAADRVAQQDLQEQEQQRRLAQLSHDCAARAAQKFGLTAVQKEGFLEVLLLSQGKLEVMEAQLTDPKLAGGLDAMIEAANGAYRDLKAWRLEELGKRLGPELAGKVNDDVEFGLLADASRIQASRSSRQPAR